MMLVFHICVLCMPEVVLGKWWWSEPWTSGQPSVLVPVWDVVNMDDSMLEESVGLTCWMNRDTEKYGCFYKESVFALTQCFLFTNKEKFLGPNIRSCFPGMLVLCPAHLPASPAISQELCGGSPRHHKSPFVEQELQHKHLLLRKQTWLFAGPYVQQQRRMEEWGINSEEY